MLMTFLFSILNMRLHGYERKYGFSMVCQVVMISDQVVLIFDQIVLIFEQINRLSEGQQSTLSGLPVFRTL